MGDSRANQWPVVVEWGNCTAQGLHGGFGCTIRSVPLRWVAIGFRAFDKLFYNRNSIRSCMPSHGNREDVRSAVFR